MRRIAFAAAFALAALSVPPAPAAERKVEIFDDDTVVIYGDSITEQNLYAAYIETFLLTRFPDKDVRVYNFGWGGDTADGANRRFARDVLPVRPTLVFVNFGMNDGRYTGFNQATHDWYMGSQRALAETIKSAGAKEVLLTTSPVHPWDWNYNDTLGRMADDVLALAEERGLKSADIFRPMYEDLKKIAEKRPGHSVIPDRVHPNAAGHILMAYYVLREIDAPGLVGEIEIDRDRVAVARSEGARVANLRSDAGVIAFDLSLPFIPFYVPPEAREALEYVPLERELNRFTLTVKGWGPRPCMLVVDGEEAGSVRAEDLAKGADLSLLDGAPWTVQGRQVWELGQFRWRKHFEAWRPMGIQAPGYAKEVPSYEALVEAQKAYVADLGAAMRGLARPRTYSVRMTVSTEVAIPAVELSPLYTWDKAEFDKSFPPETEPDKVEWRKVALDAGGFVDFTRVFQNPENCAVYARVELEASADCALRLALGSDDGLKVFANGKRILAKDVQRGYRPGEDQVEAGLKRGPNTLLFEVTQGGGGFGFGVRARVEGDAIVEVVRPRQASARRDRMKLRRYEGNPILSPNPANSWEALVTTNPGAWYEPAEGKVYMLYRAAGADAEHVIRLGLATSADGVHFERASDEPAFSPSADGFDAGCVEDPRIVKWGEHYYVTYASRPYPPGQYWKPGSWVAEPPARPDEFPDVLKRNNTSTGLAITRDFRTWTRAGRLSSPLTDDRDVILFPERIGGRFALLRRPMTWVGERYGTDRPAMWISFSEDLLDWPESKLLARGKYDWEGGKIGGNTPPVRTSRGWLTLYHGVGPDGHYRLGALLLDLEDPSVVLHRTPDWLLQPEEPYELEGYYPGVVFPCGKVVIDGKLHVYYGGADKYVGLATCELDELLDHLLGCPP